MTPKEALESIGKGTKTIVKIGYGKDNTSYLETCTIKDTKEYTVVSKALTELEELKQCDTPMKWIDVVDETGHYDKCPVCGYPSYNDLGHNHFCTVCGQRLEFEEVGNEE